MIASRSGLTNSGYTEYRRDRLCMGDERNERILSSSLFRWRMNSALSERANKSPESSNISTNRRELQSER